MTKKTSPHYSALMFSALIGVLATVGCAHVEANYPKNEGPKKWASNFEGPQCDFKGLVFKVREKSDTLEVRNMIDSLRKKMAEGAGQAQTDATFEQAQKGYELTVAMREDRSHVFYRGSLTLTETMEVVLQPGCLLLTMQTENGIETIRDSGILFPKNHNRNDFQDSGIGPVSIDLGYNRLLPGDENRLQIRSRLFGKILSVAVDSEKLTVKKKMAAVADSTK